MTFVWTKERRRIMIANIGFDWDEGNRGKCEKHGVPIAETEFALKSSPIVAPDFAHSQTERRYIAVGRTSKGRPVYIAFTFRQKAGKRLIRPLHARYMHKKEIRGYEKKAGQANTSSHHDDG
jgi:uncharacterized DUF497 family protein